MTTQQPEPSTSDSEKNADGKFYVTFSPSFACGGAKKFKFKEFNRRILTLTPGTFLQTGSIIFTYYEEEVEKNVDGGQAVGVLKNFKTPDGQAGVFVSKMDLAKGVELKNGDLILSMRRCDHTTVANDMCAVCGVNLREKDGRPGERAFKSEAKFSVVHSEPNLLVACDEAKQLGGKDEQNLLETRRLALLVDLDLTLIHTTDVPIEQGLEDVHSFELCDPNFSRHVTYHVRLRPHARRFLAESSRLFELHICTFGAREYAHRVARILDPDRSLFGRRILSRDECFDQASKRNNLHAIFPHGDHMALIIDDRDDVWDFAQNMVRVKPYKFFRHTGDINAPPGFEKRDDEPPENDLISKTKKAHLSSYHEEIDDDYLLHLRDILSRLHAEWYKLYDQMKQGLSNQYPNTHQVVPYVRAQTLSGVRLTFSGLVPTQSQTLSHPLYELARRFGAQVSLDVVGEASQGRPAWPTTHLVANRQGTAKIREAQNWPRIEIVNRNWFFLTTERWIKQPEDAHRILDDQPGPSPPANWQMANGHLMKNVENHFNNNNNRNMIVGEESQNSDLKRKLNVEESESESESESEFDDQEEDDDMAAALDAQFKN